MTDQTKFLTTRQFCDELAKQLGIRVAPTTVRIWCRERGFGKPLVPGGDYYIPVSRLEELRAAVS
jgi:hypothetical protein